MPSDSLDKLNALIPEFFYDLIGRICPGAVLCLAVGWDVRSDLTCFKELGGGVLTLLAFLLSYVAGFCLDTFSGMTVGNCYRGWVFPLLHRWRKQDVYNTDVWQVIRDSRDNETKAVLTKMMAERTMLRSLLVSWIGLWVVGSSLLVPLHVATRIVVLIVLLSISYRGEFNCRREARRALTRRDLANSGS